MPKIETRNRKQETGNKIISFLFKISSLRLKRLGFSLIELLIVISLFGLAASLITAAYLSFERNQRLKSAALALKNDIRLAQNQAHTGDKGPDSVCNIPGASLYQNVVLIGWYVTVSAPNSTLYTIKAYCSNLGTPATPYLGKTATLPNGITVSNFDTVGSGCGSLPPGTFSSANILFQPLTSDARFYDGSRTPPFFDSNGDMNKLPGVGCALEITLSGNGLTYKVDITPNGEINEKK